jgi:F-type H+-transporting ATPase subunit a
VVLTLGAGNPLDHVVQHALVDLNPGGGAFSLPIISNHIIMQLVGAGLLVYFLPRFVARRAGTDVVGKFVPRGPATMIEAVCVALREQIFRPNLGKYTDMFTPFLWTVFFFVMTSNLLGMLPLADWFWFIPGHQIGGTSTGNIWVTGALAVMVLAMMIYNGLTIGGSAYVKHFFMGPCSAWALRPWPSPFVFSRTCSAVTSCSPC